MRVELGVTFTAEAVVEDHGRQAGGVELADAPGAGAGIGAVPLQVVEHDPHPGMVGGHDVAFDVVVAEGPQQRHGLDRRHGDVECGHCAALRGGHRVVPRLVPLFDRGVVGQE